MRNSLALILITSASTVALTATSQTAQTGSPSSAAAAPTALTLTGCLEQRPGAGLTPAYVLNNSMQVASTTPRMGDPRIGTVGSASSSNTTPANSASPNANAQGAAAPAPAGTPAFYTLDGRDHELSPHIGHRVEIVGTMVAASASTPAPAPNHTSTPAATGTSGSAATPPTQTIQVTSVRMVAASCAPGATETPR